MQRQQGHAAKKSMGSSSSDGSGGSERMADAETGETTVPARSRNSSIAIHASFYTTSGALPSALENGATAFDTNSFPLPPTNVPSPASSIPAKYRATPAPFPGTPPPPSAPSSAGPYARRGSAPLTSVAQYAAGEPIVRSKTGPTLSTTAGASSNGSSDANSPVSPGFFGAAAVAAAFTTPAHSTNHSPAPSPSSQKSYQPMLNHHQQQHQHQHQLGPIYTGQQSSSSGAGPAAFGYNMTASDSSASSSSARYSNSTRASTFTYRSQTSVENSPAEPVPPVHHFHSAKEAQAAADATSRSLSSEGNSLHPPADAPAWDPAYGLGITSDEAGRPRRARTTTGGSISGEALLTDASGRTSLEAAATAASGPYAHHRLPSWNRRTTGISPLVPAEGMPNANSSAVPPSPTASLPAYTSSSAAAAAASVATTAAPSSTAAPPEARPRLGRSRTEDGLLSSPPMDGSSRGPGPAKLLMYEGGASLVRGPSYPAVPQRHDSKRTIGASSSARQRNVSASSTSSASGVAGLFDRSFPPDMHAAGPSSMQPWSPESSIYGSAASSPTAERRPPLPSSAIGMRSSSSQRSIPRAHRSAQKDGGGSSESTAAQRRQAEEDGFEQLITNYVEPESRAHEDGAPKSADSLGAAFSDSPPARRSDESIPSVTYEILRESMEEEHDGGDLPAHQAIESVSTGTACIVDLPGKDVAALEARLDESKGEDDRLSAHPQAIC